MITREIVCRNGQPVWRICSGGYCVESPSGTEAAAIMEAFEQSHGLPHSPRNVSPPYVGPDMIPDPGV